MYEGIQQKKVICGRFPAGGFPRCCDVIMRLFIQQEQQRHGLSGQRRADVIQGAASITERVQQREGDSTEYRVVPVES